MLRYIFGTILPITSIIVSPVAIALLSYLWYQDHRSDEQRHALVVSELATQVRLHASTTDALASAIKILEGNLSLTAEESRKLADALSLEQSRSAFFETEIAKVSGTVEKVSGTVGTLEKLQKTDPELLAKYSKVYFLNEHYAPANLVPVDNALLYSERRIERIRAEVLPRLAALIDAAANDGVAIYVKSAYRSYYEQASLKSKYSVLYGAGTANQFSAEQGYSEHQLGTTVDFITTGLGGNLPGFDRTTAYTWLVANAHKYGFILSYPPDNDFYVFEPWHWRFVGVALAQKLHESKTYFYDMDQRTINEYLVSIFD